MAGKKGKTLKELKLLLSKVPLDKRFMCADGKVFSNLEELRKSLKSMSSETFSHHVNSEKNDFSNWIYDVIGDADLAGSIRGTTDQKTIEKKIKTRIDYIKRKIKS